MYSFRLPLLVTCFQKLTAIFGSIHGSQRYILWTNCGDVIRSFNRLRIWRHRWLGESTCNNNSSICVSIDFVIFWYLPGFKLDAALFILYVCLHFRKALESRRSSGMSPSTFSDKTLRSFDVDVATAENENVISNDPCLIPRVVPPLTPTSPLTKKFKMPSATTQRRNEDAIYNWMHSHWAYVEWSTSRRMH